MSEFRLSTHKDEEGNEIAWYIEIKQFWFLWSGQQGVLYFNKEVAQLALASLERRGHTS